MKWGPERMTTDGIQVLLDHMLMSGCKQCRGARTAIDDWLRGQGDIDKGVAIQILSVFLPDNIGKKTMDMMLGAQSPLAVPILFESVRIESSGDQFGRVGPTVLDSKIYIENEHVGNFRTLFERQSSPEFSRMWLSSGPPSSAWDSSYDPWNPLGPVTDD